VGAALIAAGNDHLWVDDSGGDGFALVLLHPGITDSRVWDRLIPQLQGRRVVRFDRRGFGGSPGASEAYSAMDDLVIVVDALGLHRVHLVGNSMGGEAALALAVTAPERVASLTLLCPGISGYDWPETEEEPEIEAAWEAAKASGDIPALARIQAGYWLASGIDDYLERQVLLATELDHSPAAEHEQENPEQWSHLATLDVPTTVIAGELDPADSLHASIDLAHRIPGAVLVRRPVDHVPQYRDPGAVAESVLATVARAEA
jgi:3-oxoadipate enol-lactonase